MKQGVTFWVLLLLPTVVLGIGSLWLVHREADRMEDNLRAFREARLASLDQEAETNAANLLLALEEIREALLDTLADAPSNRLEQALDTLLEDNPFVRASGLWRAPDGFVAGTLQGQVDELPWDDRKPVVETPVSEERLTRQQVIARGQIRTRRQLDTIARSQSYDFGTDYYGTDYYGMEYGADQESPESGSETRSQATDAARPGFREEGGTASGWGWLSDKQQQPVLWGWIQSPATGEVRILELDTTFLHTNLQRLLPESNEGEVVWTLATAERAQSGPEELLTGEALLGSDLPGWRVQYAAAPGDPVLEVTAFRWLGSVLVMGITLSIGVGGLLLRWQLTSAAREARTKTTFLANVSHELKTPLTAIQLYVEMLGEGKIQDEAKRNRYLKTIRNEAGRLDRLLANLLDQSRLEREPDFRLNLVPLDPAAHLQGFLQQREPEISAAGLELTTRIDSAAQSVRADPDAFDQILANLLDNIVKYASGGRQVDVEAEADTKAGKYRIRMMDRGPGISPAFRSRLFTPFARSQTRLERSQGGLGVGLSIASGLARKMGGDLQYAPRPGGGASFTLSLALCSS